MQERQLLTNVGGFKWRKPWLRPLCKKIFKTHEWSQFKAGSEVNAMDFN